MDNAKNGSTCSSRKGYVRKEIVSIRGLIIDRSCISSSGGVEHLVHSYIFTKKITTESKTYHSESFK